MRVLRANMPFCSTVRGSCVREGCTVTEPFFLKEGPATFHATYQGDSIFSIRVFDLDGNATSYLVNEIGNVDTTFTFKNVFDDNYVFAVRASGPWTIEAK